MPLQFLPLTIAGWMTRDHQRVTEHLIAETLYLANNSAAGASSTRRMLSDVG